jgi:zinc finger HIT domain-containing protein 1
VSMERALQQYKTGGGSSSSSSSSSQKRKRSSTGGGTGGATGQQKGPGGGGGGRSRRSTRLKAHARGSTGAIVDEETRLRVHKARLASLEDDNYEEPPDGGNDGAYVEAEEDEVFTQGQGGFSSSGSKKARRGSSSAGSKGAGGKSKARRRSGVEPKRESRRVFTVDLLFHEDFNSPALRKRGPSWFSAAVAPPLHPPRQFCCMCGHQCQYTCTLCGSKFCSARCNYNHRETKCLKFQGV